MAFCTKCGKELREGDKFCAFCGEPVREIQEEAPPSAGPKSGRTLLVIGVVTAVIILIIIIGALFFGGESKEAAGEETSVSKGTKNETQYDTYTNDTVLFSAEYPQNYTVTEPYDNMVVFTEGEEADFQVVIEYAYHTAGDSMIYSAEDFHNQINANPKVLSDWLGTEEVQVTDEGRDKLAGKDCYQYGFEVQMDGENHTGNLYIVDGNGAFGCYTLMSMVNEEAEESELYKEQAGAVKERFCITGSYQAEGYTIYSYNDLDMKFAVRDTAMGETKQSGGNVVIYPVDKVFTEANIWIGSTSYEEGKKTAKEVLESCCNYLLTENVGGKYTSQVGTPDCGRYDYAGVNAEYYEKGEKYTLTVFTFVLDGKYRYIRTKYTDEYKETTEKALSDLLYSLKFGQDSAVAESEETGETKETQKKESRAELEIIEKIEKTEGYTKTDYWEPLAVMEDFNGDGVEEFLAVYEVKHGNTIDVLYEVWSLEESGAKKVKSEVLFTEVGGNNGVVGIVEAEGKSYLAVYRYEPEAEQFNNYYIYYPWDTQKSKLGDSVIYLECHGTYDKEEKGRYIIGDTSVEMSKFNERYEELTNWVYRLAILEGSEGNGVMSLEEMKK